ncbi:uncharacterized protein LOC134272033 [Saccostrea cucullata]|uniref:uncharacterized protein LOC134272033 n=1 Tax=Saccostrea cuccullata TaxID=36930 RepID=UPI002ED45CED
MNILTHVTMKDTNIYDEIQQILNIPENKIKSSKDEREKFLTELRREGETVHYRGRSQDSVDHVTWLWRSKAWARPDIVRSCIGLHSHWDLYIIDNKTYRKPNKILSYLPEVRCQLYCLLISDKYRISFIEQSHRITNDKIRQRYFPDIIDDGSVDLPDEITETRDGVITFISEDIRHDVMYAFVTECLVKDSDLEFFLTTASRDVISEYCRSWDYKRSKRERCLYIPYEPEEMYDLFIDSLQLDIITHCIMSDGRIHRKISERLKIPREILYWDIDARKRFVKISSQGSVNMCRARGMIVGCAGAGKTTLLRRLQRENKEENKQPTETTVGLDIHEDLFEIKDDTLIDYDKHGTKSDRTSSSTDGRQLISMTDFAGQVAYYACHQIYLSRRAFYLVVVDMSKDLEEKAMSYDTDRHSPLGSLFHYWTFADYFVFWLRSIKTYCEDGESKESRNNDTKATPVILIASHHDCVKEWKQTTSSQTAFYDALEKCLPKEHTLNDHISPTRYYEIECPHGELNEHQEEAIEQIRKYPTHAHAACRRVQEWEIFMNNGMISDSTLIKIWSENKKQSYVLEKDHIIPYMEKLGILAKMKTQEVEVKETKQSGKGQEFLYYIPSINRTDFKKEGFVLYNNGNRTPILLFSFKTYIPHFFFFRLVAICFSKWEFLSEDLLCKNIAFYKEKGGDINIAIAVNKTSIQLQAFTPDNKIKLSITDTKKIRIQIEQMLRVLTTTFHHQVPYEVGYPCKEIKITEEDENYFLPEEKIADLKTNKRICPNCIKRNHENHQIVRDDLLHYWYKRGVGRDQKRK